MSIHRRRSSSPAAPPLEDDNLLSEILLRLPPQPSSLPRASAVCKRWRHIVSDARFIRRFRRHHCRNPPLLGFFVGVSFQPTLDAPNRVAPGRLSLQQDPGDVLLPLGCRHGLVLMLVPKRKNALVWDPVTGDQHRISLPPPFDGVDPPPHGAVLRAAGDIHFQVVLVLSASDEGLPTRGFACVYLSETGLWGNLISTSLASTNVLSRKPAVLVGHSLYWTLVGNSAGILEFDLERQSLAVIQLPMGIDSEDQHQLTVMRGDGGGLGLLLLLLSKEDLGAQLWKRKTGCDGVASWESGRTIELDKLLSLDSGEKRYCSIIGFAECNSVVFLWTFVGVFMVELGSLQFKKVSEAHDVFSCRPFESVYAAGI